VYVGAFLREVVVFARRQIVGNGQKPDVTPDSGTGARTNPDALFFFA
jgi:hypothetical protein